jgi:hypothetical protein
VLERFLRAEHSVRIDADLLEAFADEATVNEALRLVLELRGCRSGREGGRARNQYEIRSSTCSYDQTGSQCGSANSPPSS